VDQTTEFRERKQTLIGLVERLHARSDLSYPTIRERMGTTLGCEYSEGRFLKFISRPEIRSDYQLDEVFALVRAVTDGLEEYRRSTAREAIQIFDLTGFELKEFTRLLDIFPQQEFDKAWEQYLAERKLSSTQTSSDGDFLVPLYPYLFIGRENDIEVIYGRLGVYPTPRVPLTIVRGWPGVGKTTLINRLVHTLELKKIFKNGILWCSLGADGKPLPTLKRWAKQLHIFEIEPMQKLDEVIARLRTALLGREIALIVDDIWTADDGKIFKNLAGPHTTFLMTTRFTDVAIALSDTPNDIYVLPTLTSQKSLEMLQIIAPNACRNHAKKIDTLIEALDGLPLALRIAGNLIEQEEKIGLDVDALIDELVYSHSILLEGQSGAIDEATGTSPSFALLMERSVNTLSPVGQKAFAYLGAFQYKPATFDLKALKRVWSVDDPTELIRVLIGRGLVEPLGAGRFQIHNTLAMYARQKLDQMSD